MFKRIFSNLALTALLALGAFSVPAVAQDQATTPNCTGGGEAWVDGVCRQVRTYSEVNPMFVPERIKIGTGSTAYYLDPTTQYSSWDKCTSGIGAQDSTCVVPYRYGVAAGLATITASFSKTSPFINSTGTSPRWTTTNAVSLTVNCSGVATYNNANAPVQANPSGVTLNSAVAGPVTCVLTALNSDKEPVSLTITANFTAPIPPTIQAGFVRPNFNAGTGGSEIYWATQNTKTVYVTCSGFNWGPGYVGLQGNPSGVRMDRDTTGAISCTFTATNEIGQTATATATANVVRPPPPWVSAQYSPANIVAGQQSQLLYNSGNAVSLGLVCSGLQWFAVRDPSLLLNQSWYFFTETWPDPGTQECGIAAHNSLGEVSYAYFTLVVAPAGFKPTGGGSAGATLYPPGTPGLPTGGSSGGSSRPVGYTNPVTGVVSANPDGTGDCNGCRSDPSVTTNSGTDTPKPTAPATGGEDNSGNGGGGNT